MADVELGKKMRFFKLCSEEVVSCTRVFQWILAWCVILWHMPHHLSDYGIIRWIHGTNYTVSSRFLMEHMDNFAGYYFRRHSVWNHFLNFFFSLLGEINAIQPLWDLLLYLKINPNLARSVRTGDKNGAAIIGFTLEVEKSISSYSALISCIIWSQVSLFNHV